MAIRDVTVVDVMDGSLHPARTVLIAGNRIAAVEPAAETRIGDDVDVVEGAGGYLIPGLWDMHVHSVANVALDLTVRSVTTADWHFPLFLVYGITGVRNMNEGVLARAVETLWYLAATTPGPHIGSDPLRESRT